MNGDSTGKQPEGACRSVWEEENLCSLLAGQQLAELSVLWEEKNVCSLLVDRAETCRCGCSGSKLQEAQ